MPLYALSPLSALVVYSPSITTDYNGPQEAANCHIHCVKYDKDVKYGAAAPPKLAQNEAAYVAVAQLIRMQLARAVLIYFRTISLKQGIITPKDTTVNGRLNDAVPPTKYANLFYNLFADFLLLGSIQIDREVL
eukprot:scaffold3362_cov122-Skeletonema_menzelii.AAC.1